MTETVFLNVLHSCGAIGLLARMLVRPGSVSFAPTPPTDGAGGADGFDWPSWDASATLIAAAIAAFMAWRSVRVIKRTSAREHALSRFSEAIEQIESGTAYRVEFGVGLLKSLRASGWLSQEDKRLAQRTLEAYNYTKSAPGGV